MFLFGEEVGAQKDFIYDHVLENREDLVGLRQTTGKFLFAFYGDLIRLRLAHPGLRSRNIDVLYSHNANRVLAFRRWDGSENFLVLASLNNRPFGSGYVVQNAAPARRLLEGSVQQRFRPVRRLECQQLRGRDHVGRRVLKRQHPRVRVRRLPKVLKH